ncbi:Hypothetical predicted protein [Octopus vulgaris]|uniref:Uncharacterized protein n=1 Tax=Octopus vulgaris TaxID=6645 RepID=A0AA36FCH7_OCTVU|nr:Hypothetical predicted protein [Octopus vulgaris]
MEIPEMENHDSMIFTVSPSTSSSNFTDSEESCDIFSAAMSMNHDRNLTAAVERCTPLQLHLCRDSNGEANILQQQEMRSHASDDNDCPSMVGIVLPHTSSPTFNDTNSIMNQSPVTSSNSSQLPCESSNTNESLEDKNLRVDARKVYDMLQEERIANLTKRKHSFWRALKNFQLAKINMNWSNQAATVLNILSASNAPCGDISALAELGEYLIPLCFKAETLMLLHKVQKSATKYKKIDESMEKTFQKHGNGELYRRLLELWRVETVAEEITSFMTWNSKKEWYTNACAYFNANLKERGKHKDGFSSKQNHSIAMTHKNRKGRILTENYELESSSESVRSEANWWQFQCLALTSPLYNQTGKLDRTTRVTWEVKKTIWLS